MVYRWSAAEEPGVCWHYTAAAFAPPAQAILSYN
jgi:hypothetical protein